MIAVVLSLLILSLVARVLAARFGALLLLSVLGWICNSRCTHPPLPRSLAQFECFNCWMYHRAEKLGGDIADFFEMTREYFTSSEFWLPLFALIVILVIALI